MGKIAANVARTWIDEFDVSGSINAGDFSVKQETAVVTCLSDTGPRRVVGNYEHTGGGNGFFDGVAAAFDARAFIDLRTDEDHYRSDIYGVAAGSRCYDRVVRLPEQVRSSAVGGAVLLNLTDEGSGPIVRGQLLLSATAVAIGDAATGYNGGVITFAAGFGYAALFRVISVVGSGSITIVIKESDDGSTDPYAAIAGITATFTAVGVQRKTQTGTADIGAFRRVSITAFSGFTSAVVLVTGGKVS